MELKLPRHALNASSQAARVPLGTRDLELVAAIQDGLPLCPRPYAAVGRRLGMTEAEVMDRLAALQRQGVIHRLGVIVRHRALGYRANAMVVWDVPDEEVGELGRLFAQQPFITLCYRRPRRGRAWPYNLFCMIHGRDRAEVRRRLGDMIRTLGLEDLPHAVLFSRRCFKQCGARYLPTEPAPAGTRHGHARTG